MTNITIANSENYEFDIKHYKGKVVYLDFWASWCIPCRKSFPWMNEMHNNYESSDLVVIAVNLDEDKSEALRFLEMYQVDFLIAYDSGVLAEKYQVQGMPYSVLFNKVGEIVKTTVGFKLNKTKEYENSIKKELGIE